MAPLTREEFILVAPPLDMSSFRVHCWSNSRSKHLIILEAKTEMYTSIIGALLILQSIVSAAPAGTSCDAVGISPSRGGEVKAAFTNAKLTPQAITSGINPRVEVKAAYGSKQVNLGNTFTTLETASAPSISFTAERDYDPATTKYFIFLVDPDAPGPTKTGAPAALGFFLHTAIYNAQPSCIMKQTPITITVPGYRALTPLSVAPHRYTFLVYRQPPDYKPPVTLAVTTSNFDLNGFVRQQNLVLVGGNYFLEGAGNVISP